MSDHILEAIPIIFVYQCPMSLAKYLTVIRNRIRFLYCTYHTNSKGENIEPSGEIEK